MGKRQERCAGGGTVLDGCRGYMTLGFVCNKNLPYHCVAGVMLSLTLAFVFRAILLGFGKLVASATRAVSSGVLYLRVQLA